MSKDKNPKVFPEIFYSESERALTMATMVRKFHEGKYYLVTVFKAARIDNITYEQRGFLLNLFMNEVFLTHQLAKVDTEATHPGTDMLLFKLDPNQEPESERIAKLIPQASMIINPNKA